jgi:DNA mismatch repair protein MutL
MPANRNPIRVLPKDLAEKIAAGEVVERPGSVIKELVENSIDAGAKTIRVDLEEGGRRRMSVTDDGHGIPEDEILTALERHATSKITNLDDLWNLHTMGFRGEALPSIAAVSRLTIESRAQSQAGRKVYLEGGKLLKNEALFGQTEFSTGTMIAVEDLFFNVPARLKFLRAKSSESGFIRELLERIAFCNPSTAFTLYSDGRKLLNLKGTSPEDFLSRAAAIFETTPENIETFESQFENIKVQGWLDRDGRATNSRQLYLAVNGRMVRDKLLQQAILVALRPRMMEGEYPKVYLSVEVPPGDVDVNVHPAKSEVRFHKSKDVFQVVHGALERLARTPQKAYYSVKLGTDTDTETESGTGTGTANRSPLTESVSRVPRPESVSVAASVSASRSGTVTATGTVTHSPSTDHRSPSSLFPNERTTYKTKDYLAVNLGGMVMVAPTSESNSNAVSSDSVDSVPGFSKLHYIGQLKNTYLLFQDGNGLVVVDQHAAHERINYERIKTDFLENGLKPQPLLVSAVVKGKPDEVALALDHADAFSKLGFEFEAFGDNCLLIRAAPQDLAPDRASELFRSLLSELSANEVGDLAAKDPSRLSPKLERILATAACHGSVRAGQSLSPNEAKKLASQMDETESSLNCPHGRPASIRLTFAQIEGLFKRS